MRKYVDILVDSFYTIFIIVCGGFVAFWAATLFIGSKEMLQELVTKHGFTTLLLKRSFGFTLFGIVLSMSLALLSLVRVLCSENKDFKEPFRVFIVAAIFQTGCALIGSLFFWAGAIQSIRATS